MTVTQIIVDFLQEKIAEVIQLFLVFRVELALDLGVGGLHSQPLIAGKAPSILPVLTSAADVDTVQVPGRLVA